MLAVVVVGGGAVLFFFFVVVVVVAAVVLDQSSVDSGTIAALEAVRDSFKDVFVDVESPSADEDEGDIITEGKSLEDVAAGSNRIQPSWWSSVGLGLVVLVVVVENSFEFVPTTSFGTIKGW